MKVTGSPVPHCEQIFQSHNNSEQIKADRSKSAAVTRSSAPSERADPAAHKVANLNSADVTRSADPVTQKAVQTAAHKTAGLKSADLTRSSASAAQTPQKAGAETGASAAVLNRLLVSLGLPADKLSAATVSFARFFSLPLESGLLAKIRRQAFLQGQSAQKAGAEGRAGVSDANAAGKGAAANRETLSFAAAAAASKGVELTPAALERYAAVLKLADTDDAANVAKGEANAPDAELALPSTNADGGQGGGFEEPPRKHTPEQGRHTRTEAEAAADGVALSGGVAELKERFLQAAVQDPLLETMNRLPGKDGQRWLVFPLSFGDGGGQYRIALKILLDGNGNSLESGGICRHMTLEIVKVSGFSAENRNIEKKKQRWLFVADSENGKNLRLNVYLDPPRHKRALKSLARRIGSCLEMPPDGVFVQNWEDSSFFAAEIHDGRLLSVNKAV